MKLISKEKLIKVIINECKEFKKIIDYLYTNEFKLILSYRVEKVYNLNYTMTTEARLFLIDLINNYCYEEMTTKDLKTKLRKLIK